MLTEYQPELWTVKKDDIYAVIHALDTGLEHTKSALADHEVNYGRVTRKDRLWAEQIEKDIEVIELALESLRKCHA